MSQPIVHEQVSPSTQEAPAKETKTDALRRVSQEVARESRESAPSYLQETETPHGGE